MKLGRATPTEIDFRVAIRLTWVLKFVLQCFRVHLPQQECECEKCQRNSQGQAQEGPENNVYPFHRAGHAFSKRFVKEIRSQSKIHIKYEFSNTPLLHIHEYLIWRVFIETKSHVAQAGL